MEKKERIPPGQSKTEDFPVLHVGDVPVFDPKTWIFSVEGLVENPVTVSFDEFRKIAPAESTSDFHCVTGWSRLDNRWEGLLFKDLCKLVKPLPEAKFVSVIAEGDYTTSLSMEEMLEDEVIFAWSLEGKPLEPDHGGPLRAVVPHKYAYKCAKWVRKLIFTAQKEPGYWETRGYSDSADPWKEERFD
ncbi:MAG: sulfite oxidase-like oxidoreductase [Firmicutes bacterium]|nr:sulfite oxidase-like oxidoreductase [Bacillota bacterium]